MFLVTTPFERGARAEIEQAEQAGRAAQRAGLRHLVYSSVTHAMTLTPVILAQALGRSLRYEPRTFAELDPMLGRLFAVIDGGPRRRAVREPRRRPAARGGRHSCLARRLP